MRCGGETVDLADEGRRSGLAPVRRGATGRDRRVGLVEVWLHALSFPGRTAALAARAEAWGYTGMLVADSQNLNADVWLAI